MERLILNFFLENWQRKLIALISATVIWLLVNHSITSTRVIPNVPIRIVNLPSDKTVQGLLPNGLLSKRVTLTVSGSKDVVDQLEPGDLEIIIDASNKGDEWIVQVSKKNLVGLNPDIDLLRNITQVTHNEFIIKLSRLITDKIPVMILPPIGEPPQGYQFLDIWPQRLTHTVSGPEEQIEELQTRGLEISFDLSQISKEDLDALQSSNFNFHDDEVSYFVPQKWKRVALPFLNNEIEEINGLEVQNLRIDFLRKELLSLDREMPVRVFYPIKYSETLNPDTHPLVPSSLIKNKDGIMLLESPLFVKEVSRLFLDIVRDHLEITIIASPKSEKDKLDWSVQFIDPDKLEEMYVSVLMLGNIQASANSPIGRAENFNPEVTIRNREEYLRKRFREYMRKFELYKSKDQPLQMDVYLQEKALIVENGVSSYAHRSN